MRSRRYSAPNRQRESRGIRYGCPGSDLWIEIVIRIQTNYFISPIFQHNMDSKFIRNLIMFNLHAMECVLIISLPSELLINLLDCHLRNFIKKFLKHFYIFYRHFRECIALLQRIFKREYKWSICVSC